MGEHVIRLPDVGEGVAEAELVEWHVQVGDVVREDMVIAAVMTDKATVEIPSPVDGRVAWVAGEIGQSIAVGADLVRLEVEGEGQATSEAAPRVAAAQDAAPDPEPAAQTTDEPVAAPAAKRPAPRPVVALSTAVPPRAEGDKPLAAPSVRRRAREAGLDLRQLRGTGPAGRITHGDLDAVFANVDQVGRGSALQPNTAVEEIKVVGLRRRIAERMAEANSHIPHITYVEEVDVTKLEDLRHALNAERSEDRPKLTLLPFLMRAMVRAVADQPGVNAHFDDDNGILRQYGGVHAGIATQTPTGLVVPVVRHVEARDIWGCAGEINRLAEEARSGTVSRDDLTGSTITITSLGALGGIVSTPIINRPEVAIVGVNRMAVRPHWDGTEFVPRKMMNLSSSFDHRVIDGWNAARFVQRIKTLLETPAMLFVDG